MPESVQAAVFVPFESLVPWDRNPRNNEEAIPRVMRSLETFGFGRPLIAWGSTGSRRLVVGHTTFAAYSKLVAKHGEDWHPGGTPAPGMVPVRWRDDWTEEQVAGYAIADNRLGEIATWDEAVLAELLGELKLGDVDLDAVGYSEADLDGLVERPEPPEAPEPEAPPEEPVSRAGEVYELGPHRLVCGDCTNASVIEALMEGERADSALTDPPYQMGKDIIGDDLPDDEFESLHRGAFAAMPVGANATLICFHGTRAFPAALKAGWATGWDFKRMLWLSKPNDCTFPWRGWILISESILVFSRGQGCWNEVHPFVHDTYTHNHSGGEMPESAGWHPSVKPSAVCEDLIQRISPDGGTIFDGFGGSGSTLIACARTGRRARLIELDPRYCDVIRRRWTQWATEAGVDPGPGALA